MLFVKLSSAFGMLMLSLLSTTVFAESPNQTENSVEPIYQVEFLVLRPYQRNDLNIETWSQIKPKTPYPLQINNQAKSKFDNADPLAVESVLASLRSGQGAESNEPAITQLEGFSWVTQAQWNLPYTIRRIDRGGEYEILMHKVWRQVATARDQLVPLTVALPFDVNNQAISEQQVADQSNAQAIKNGLFGNFAFSKGRYLHVTMDFVLAEAKAPNAAAVKEQYGFSRPLNSDIDSTGFSFGLDTPEAVIEYYRLNETRRIKADETHYFDHPAFSVLAYVSRIKDTAPTQEPAEPVQSEPVPAATIDDGDEPTPANTL